MSLANFFDKAALGAAQVLKGFDRANFENVLESHIVGIAFDKKAAGSTEGKATLDLLIRLCARLYPNLQVIDITGNNTNTVSELEALALNINPKITLSKKKKPTISVVVGSTDYKITKGASFYVGSEEWTVKFSLTKSIGSGKSNNPFGAGAAACVGAANIFRVIFKDQLSAGKFDKDFTLCLFNYVKDPKGSDAPSIPKIHIDETLLVGLGAIGNGVIWALKRILGLSGELSLIDHQTIDLSNLQRYVLAEQQNIGEVKVEVAEKYLKKSELKINKYPLTWEQYLQKRNDWKINRVAVCVDSARDRIAMQGAMPYKIFNAWTQPDSLGLSRHTDFINSACLTCLYIPEVKKKSKSETIAESLGLGAPDQERIVRGYLALGKAVDNPLLSLISTAKGIAVEELLPYIGKPLEVFYSEVVCGGVMMRLAEGKEEAPKIEVPSAFESALAGILLAAEIVIDAGQLRKKPLPVISRINLLKPISGYLLEEQSKHHSLRCICQDETFQKVYTAKYSNI